LGSYKTAFGGKTYRDFASYPDQPEDVPFDWRLGVARSFSSVYDPSFDVVLPDPEVPSVEDFTLLLNDQGTDFIRKYRPGNPVVNLGQFFGELHQLPRLPIFLKSRTKHFSDLGSEYLNVEFGWKPFVKDLIAAYKLQQTISARLERLRRDNGLAIRKRSKHRGTEVLTDSDGDTLTKPFGDLSDLAIGGSDKLEGYHVLGPFPYWFSYDPLALQGVCQYEYDTFRDEQVWECGTFFYYIPEVGTDRWTERAKAELFGSSPTPSVLYELLPWSWLVDWFTNVGDIISNASTNAVDNEALTNCFSMRSITDRVEIQCKSSWEGYEFGGTPPPGATSIHFSFSAGSDSCRFSLLKRNKMRRVASPFGFGLKRLDFTARQYSILAAIASSKRLPPRVEGAFRSLF
jgi:hypothetical protein